MSGCRVRGHSAPSIHSKGSRIRTRDPHVCFAICGPWPCRQAVKRRANSSLQLDGLYGGLAFALHIFIDHSSSAHKPTWLLSQERIPTIVC
ncbi:hypothetical protein M3J09_002694 [Ascochyta lentis]